MGLLFIFKEYGRQNMENMTWSKYCSVYLPCSFLDKTGLLVF